MLVGNADVAALAEHAPTVTSFVTETIELNAVVCFQLTAEMRNSAREAVLPPSLHPTTPAALSIQVYAVGESPWGAFRFATTRISCRSGVRARGFTTRTLVDGEAACEGLKASLGFPTAAADVHFRHGYDGVSVAVDYAGRQVLGVEAIDPDPMGPGDVQYTGTLNLAHTPMGLRLMQVEANPTTWQVDRLTASLNQFDGAAWGNELLVPSRVIAASVVKLDLSFPPVRFVCKADELAFTGTQAVEA